jgi:streptogramin lyase
MGGYVKKFRMGYAIALMILLAACGPVTPAPAVSPAQTSLVKPTPSQIPTSGSPVQAAKWTSLHAGWMTFPRPPAIRNAFYDPNGYIWAAGTFPGGLYRWDVATGAVDRYFSAGSQPQYIDSLILWAGKVWVVLNNGEVDSFSGNAWTTETTLPKDDYVFFKTDDRLWVAGEGKLYSYNGNDWKLFDALPGEYRHLSWIARSKDGSLWFSLSSKDYAVKVLRFDGHNWKNYDNLAFARNAITTADGALWFVASDMLVSFDGHNLAPLVLPGNYFSYQVKNSLPLAGGGLWLQTDAGTFTIHGREVTKMDFSGFGTRPADVYDERPLSLTPQGWLFSGGDGAYLYNGASWKKYAFPDSSLISQLVGKVGDRIIGFTPDGALWAWDEDEPVRFDGQRIDASYKFDIDGHSAGVAGSISHIDSDGVLWSAYPNTETLSFGKPGGGKVAQLKLRNPIKDFALAPNGDLWLALGGGYITSLSPKQVEMMGLTDYDWNKVRVGGEQESHVLEPVRIEIGDDGGIWVYVKDIGLYKYIDKHWNYLGANLSDKSAFAIGANGRIWAGSNYNLFGYDGKTWMQYSHNCIFPSHVTIAPDQSVWFINGCDGVYRFDGKDWTHFAKEKELAGIIPTQIMVAPDGALWFFSYSGWARYQP